MAADPHKAQSPRLLRLHTALPIGQLRKETSGRQHPDPKQAGRGGAWSRAWRTGCLGCVANRCGQPDFALGSCESLEIREISCSGMI